jgi:hypothetical protein
MSTFGILSAVSVNQSAQRAARGLVHVGRPQMAGMRHQLEFLETEIGETRHAAGGAVRAHIGIAVGAEHRRLASRRRCHCRILFGPATDKPGGI